MTSMQFSKKVKLCRDVLRTAFDELFKAEARINDLYMEMAEEGAEINALMGRSRRTSGPFGKS